MSSRLEPYKSILQSRNGRAAESSSSTCCLHQKLVWKHFTLHFHGACCWKRCWRNTGSKSGGASGVVRYCEMDTSAFTAAMFESPAATPPLVVEGGGLPDAEKLPRGGGEADLCASRFQAVGRCGAFARLPPMS